MRRIFRNDRNSRSICDQTPNGENIVYSCSSLIYVLIQIKNNDEYTVAVPDARGRPAMFINNEAVTHANTGINLSQKVYIQAQDHSHRMWSHRMWVCLKHIWTCVRQFFDCFAAGPRSQLFLLRFFSSRFGGITFCL